MGWLDFTSWWMEWPPKITAAGILVVALLLSSNNVVLMVLRQTVLIRTTKGWVSRRRYASSAVD